jgi:hypothetical protein
MYLYVVNGTCYTSDGQTTARRPDAAPLKILSGPLHDS